MSTVRKNVPGKITGFSQKSCVFCLAEVRIHCLLLSNSHEFRFDAPYFSLLSKTKLQLPQAPFGFGRNRHLLRAAWPVYGLNFPLEFPVFLFLLQRHLEHLRSVKQD